MPQCREIGLCLEQWCPSGIAWLVGKITAVAQHRGGSRQRVGDRLLAPWYEGLSTCGAEENLRLYSRQPRGLTMPAHPPPKLIQMSLRSSSDPACATTKLTSFC
eukprot:9503190-Pyramimonas_sp.AAC.1